MGKRREREIYKWKIGSVGAGASDRGVVEIKKR